jgi:hypothetical protein
MVRLIAVIVINIGNNSFHVVDLDGRGAIALQQACSARREFIGVC